MTTKSAEKCVCCAKPANKQIIFFTADKGLSYAEFQAGGTAKKTEYYNIEKHREWFCYRCLCNFQAIPLFIGAIAVIIICSIAGFFVPVNVEEFLIWLTLIAAIVGVAQIVRFLPSESNAILLAQKKYPDKAIFKKDVEPKIKGSMGGDRLSL